MKKPTKKIYYVLYEQYTEFNQFEGGWDLNMETFKSIGAAQMFMNKVKDSSNYRTVIGPLNLCE
jgi:hypothetical protein